LPKRELELANIVFHVSQDGERFGKLLVSKGAAVWRAKGKTKGRKLDWKRFDEVMQNSGRIVRGG
jgi:hypothetical protein